MSDDAPKGDLTDYREAVERLQRKSAPVQASVLTYQFDLAKWIMASLLLLNGGTLATVANSGDLAPALVRACATPLVIGVVTAIASGAFAWVNAAVIFDIYDDILNPAAVEGPDKWPVVRKGAAMAVTATTALSIVCVLVSTASFCWAVLAARSAAGV